VEIGSHHSGRRAGLRHDPHEDNVRILPAPWSALLPAHAKPAPWSATIRRPGQPCFRRPAHPLTAGKTRSVE
jgi:hypothetical protein